jgi:hypothetical protein
MGCVLALVSVGCFSGPPVDNPVLVRNLEPVENPILVSPGQPTAASYREVFEKCVDVLADYFTFQVINPYEGRIITKPRPMPGYEQWFKGGNPDPRSRLWATFQSMRQIAIIEIRTGERGGYLVSVIVERELEDAPRPLRNTIGNPTFQDAPTVARPAEVQGADLTLDRTWFRVGRDYAFEQELLRRIRQCK